MKITGIEAVVVDGNFDWPLIRVTTDEGIAGYGEVRDHVQGKLHSPYIENPADLALDLEEHLVGRDPTNVTDIYADIRRFGGWGRFGGGISGIEIALLDILGKHVGEPIYKLLGGSHREEVQIYCDTHAGKPIADSATDYELDETNYTPDAYASQAETIEAKGYDFIKFDLDPRAVSEFTDHDGVRGRKLTPAGLEYLADVVEAIRNAIEPDTEIAFDCFSMRDLQLSDVIKFGQAVDEYDVAFLEDLRHDDRIREWGTLTESIETATLVGEDLYTVDGFRPLFEANAVQFVGPDLLTAGGIRETVNIARRANQEGMLTALHFAGSPIGMAASLHAAAAMPNLLAAEFHAIGTPWWDDILSEPTQMIENGTAVVPDGPGLGIDPALDVINEHRKAGEEPL